MFVREKVRKSTENVTLLSKFKRIIDRRKHFCKLRKYQFHLWNSVFFYLKFYLVIRILEEWAFGNPFVWFLVNEIGKFECVSANVFPDLFLWICFGDCVSNLHLVLNVCFIFHCLLFFYKKSIFRNIYISVNTIFQCFDMFGWE